MNENFWCSTSLLVFGVVSVPDFGHSNRYVAVSCLNLHFPDDIWCGASFHMLICHLYIIFGELSKFLAHFLIRFFVFLLLSFKRSVYIWDNISFSHLSFANNFSQSVACPLIFLTSSFTEQKFLILMKSSLSMISFINHVYSVLSKKTSPYPRSSKFSPMLFSRNFIVLHFTRLKKNSLKTIALSTVETLAIRLIIVPLKVTFGGGKGLAAFKIFLLSLTFSSFTMMWPDVHTFLFILVGFVGLLEPVVWYLWSVLENSLSLSLQIYISSDPFLLSLHFMLDLFALSFVFYFSSLFSILLFHWTFFLFLINFYWSIVDLPCYASLCFTEF